MVFIYVDDPLLANEQSNVFVRPLQILYNKASNRALPYLYDSKQTKANIKSLANVYSTSSHSERGVTVYSFF